MINHSIQYLFLAMLILMLGACTSSIERPQPYWLKKADDFMAQGIVLYDQQRYSLSATEFSHAFKSYQRFDYVEGLAQSYLNLAKTEIAQDHTASARHYLQSLNELIDENNFESLRIHMDIMYSSIAINEDKAEYAIEVLMTYLGEAGENKLNVADIYFLSLLTNRVRSAIKLNIDIERNGLQYTKPIRGIVISSRRDC